MKNVTWVYKSGLCHGCGACMVSCLKDAIVMKNEGGLNYPSIGDQCNQCGLCNSVCSGQQGSADIRHSRFQELLDDGRGIFLAEAANPDVRARAASGGFVTAHLIYLLDKGFIDGAIVVASDGRLSSICARILRTKEEILLASSSKYHPVSVCAALKYVKAGEKYAFVGKGCDLASISLLQKAMPSLNDAIYIKIGLLCHHTPVAKASVELFEKSGLEYTRDSDLVYRSEGWPGDAVLRSGDDVTRLEYRVSWGETLGREGNIPFRCRICNESFAEHSDIAVGDPWSLNPELRNSGGGKSLVLTYTQKGRDEISSILESGEMVLRKADVVLLIESQRNLIRKYEGAYLRMMFLRLLGRKGPLSHISRFSALLELFRFVRKRKVSIRRMASIFKSTVRDNEYVKGSRK